MAFSYSGDPSNSDLDAIRFLLDDTDSTDYQFEDAELEYLIGLFPNNIYYAAAVGAERLASKFSSSPNISADGVSYSQGSLARNWFNRAKELRYLGKRLNRAKPYVGGISESDKESVENDEDRVEPHFTVDMHENVGSTTSSQDELRADT